MISKKQAERVYDRNTKVIRKGDKDWKSDNHLEGCQGERYGSNPLSLIDQKIRQAHSREVDYSLLPPPADHSVGDVVTIPMENGRDLMAFRLVALGEWKSVWTEKNGQLQ